MSPEEPTDVMPGGPDGPTEVNSPGDDPTRPLGGGGERPTDVLPETAGGGRKGLLVLLASIVASLLLVGAYMAAGGLGYGPDKPADPCDPRPWTDPQDLEETAQQFALSAADGAACELGVSREELTRSITSDDTRQDFMDEHGFTEPDLEDALRAGLERAVDDAENADAIGGLAATGIRAAIKVMPMSAMIGLLENADSIFGGDLGSLGGVGDAIEAITGDSGGGSGGSGKSGDPLGGLGDAIEEALPEGTTDSLRDAIPDGTKRRLKKGAEEKLKQGLDGLLGP